MSKKLSKREALKPLYVRPHFHKQFKEACIRKGVKMGFTLELLICEWVIKQD